MPGLQQQPKKKRKKVDVAWLDRYMPKYARKIYEKTGLKVQDPTGGVGCGLFGCVYLTDDPKWVVKVTRDQDEGPLALRIVELRKELGGGDGYGPSTALPGIVFFKDIFQARTIEYDRRHFKPYVLIRENVRPAEDEDVEEKMTWYVDKHLPTDIDDDDDKKKHQHARDMSHPGLNIAMLWARLFHMYVDDSRKLGKAMTNYIEWLDEIKDEFPLIVKDMFYLMGEEHNLVLMDVHAYNIGYSIVDWGSQYRRPGSAVIHDLGMTPTIPKTRFRMLNPLHIEER
jgi:hypothetical protein